MNVTKTFTQRKLNSYGEETKIIKVDIDYNTIPQKTKNTFSLLSLLIVKKINQWE